MGKLTFVSIFAFPVLLERTTEFSLVAIGILVVTLIPVTFAESTVTWPGFFTVIEIIAVEYGIGPDRQD